MYTTSNYIADSHLFDKKKLNMFIKNNINNYKNIVVDNEGFLIPDKNVNTIVDEFILQVKNYHSDEFFK